MQYKDIHKLALENENFRTVVFTNEHSQVVLMSVKPGDDIGDEVHNVDQVLFFVKGQGKAVVGGQEHAISGGDMVDVPSGTRHNFINTGTEDLKLYTVYAPSEHAAGTIHKTKEEAEAAERSEHVG